MIESPLLPSTHGYIDGAWSAADNDRTFAVRNPANGEHLADVAAMGPIETERAIASARAALAVPATLDERRGWLEAITAALREERREIGRILTLEHGKPWKEAQGEVDYAAGFFEFCAKHVDALASRELDERPKGHRWRIHYRPAGVVGLITPWNFPIGMIAKKLSAALAADCPSIIKPSSKTPLTMIALFHLLDSQVDLPPGKVNLVTGPAAPISDVLCHHRDVAMLSFTGSTEVGRKLIGATADQVKKLALELGGNAPFIVFDDADLGAAADHLIANKFRGGGQTCVCANRIYVQRGVADAFLAEVGQRVSRMRVGDGMDEGTDIGPLIDRQGFDKVHRHLEDALARGARKVAGEDPPASSENGGWYFPPTVIRDVTHEMICTREETFGPLVPVIGFDDDDEVLAEANDTEFGLAAYIFTASEPRARKAIAALQFGHVGWNTGTGPTPEAPFGGMKQSGYGREGGFEGLFEFVEPQTVPHPL